MSNSTIKTTPGPKSQVFPFLSFYWSWNCLKWKTRQTKLTPKPTCPLPFPTYKDVNSQTLGNTLAITKLIMRHSFCERAKLRGTVAGSPNRGKCARPCVIFGVGKGTDLVCPSTQEAIKQSVAGLSLYGMWTYTPLRTIYIRLLEIAKFRWL